MNEALFPRRDALRRGGFTLVEVVIALAIFVFGAVAIIRIFPPALGVIQNSGDKLTATNINRTTLAKVTKEGGSVPYAVHDVYSLPPAAPTPEQLPLASAVVGTAIRNNSLPKRNTQTVDASSSLGRFKYISGEKEIVRATTITLNGVATPSTYVLTSFPIAPDPTVTTKQPTAQVYKEVNVEGVMARTKTVGTNKSGFLDFSDASPAPPAYNKNLFYHVSYNFFENGFLNGTDDEVVRSTTPSATGTANTFLISATPPDLTTANSDVQLLQGRRLTSPTTATAPANGVVDGPVQVSYRQPYGTITVDSDRDQQNARNNLGMLILTGVNMGDEVSVDYQVNDWRQIVNNSLPTISPEATPTPGPNPAQPSPSPRELVLPIRGLADDTNDAGSSTYSLLTYLNTDASNTLTSEANTMKADDTLVTPNQYTLWGINRKGGRVLFDISDHNTATPQDYQVLQSRVVFQTLDNWTHQLSVAPLNYTPYYGVAFNNRNTGLDFTGDNGNVNVAEPWRYYAWSPRSERIYFPPSEAGKTISLSYTYVIGGVTKQVNDGVVTISPTWIPDTDAPAGVARQLAISDNDPTNPQKWLAYAEPQTSGSTALPLTSILSIKGLSIQARTAWLDGSNFTQVSTTGFRGGSN